MRMVKKMLKIAMILTFIISMLTVSGQASYDGQKAARYARKYAENYNPYYESFSGKGGDCTNFVSQCLRDGGLVTNNSNSKGFGVNNESKQWYHDQYTTWRKLFGLTWGYKTEWKISTTWIRVSNTGSGKGLYQYLSNTKGYKVINTSAYSDIIRHARVGDVIQMAKTSGGAKSHTVIVTSRRDNDIGVTYHTSDRNDVSFEKFLWKNYSDFYLIKVK